MEVGDGANSVRGMDGAAYAAWRDWQATSGPEALVAAAVLAPSPHNSQPWSFRISGNAIDVHADLSRATGALDPYGRELHIGLGCALENLMLAASAHGYRTSVELLPAPGHVAHVGLAPGPVHRSELYDAIGKRHTDRSAYADRAVAAELLERMSALADAGPRLVWVTDTAHVGRLMVDAARAVTQDEAQSRDGYQLVRSSRADVERFKDGLTLDTMAMPALLTAILKRLPPTGRSRADAFWVRTTERTQTRTAAAYGFVAVPDSSDDRARIDGGRLLERVHLWTTANGLSLQHMNQLTERVDRERELSLEPVFGAAVQALMPDGLQALAAFRIGYARGSAGRRLSPRRPVAEVLVSS